MCCERENGPYRPQIEARKPLQHKGFFGPEQAGAIDYTEKSETDFNLRKTFSTNWNLFVANYLSFLI